MQSKFNLIMKKYFRILSQIPKFHFGLPLFFLLITILVNQYLLNED